MNGEDDGTPRLRAQLSSHERQALINQRETTWMRDLQSMAIDAGHHPFLSAGDSEVVEARFFERLRLGTPFERTLMEEELPSTVEAVAAAAAIDRAVVVFSPNAGLLGAFVSSSSAVLPKLGILAVRAGYELGLMSLDAAHGFSIDRVHYDDSGEHVAAGVLLVRAWGDFAPPA
jgi:hypothetical protein